MLVLDLPTINNHIVPIHRDNLKTKPKIKNKVERNKEEKGQAEKKHNNVHAQNI